MSLKENFLSFEFSIFLDDHTSKLKKKRRFSENFILNEFKSQKQETPLISKKRKRSCSIETSLDTKSNNFSLANFYPRFERFTSNEDLFVFSSINSICEENHEENVVKILKEKFCENFNQKLKDFIVEKSFN